MYHGFMASMCQPPHRLLVQLAEALAQLGIVSLRIDLPGRGDSECDTLNLTVEDNLAATQKAIDVLVAQQDIDSSSNAHAIPLNWSHLQVVDSRSR